MIARLVVGLVLTVLVLAVAGRRAFWLYRLISSGQPDHARSDQLGARLRVQLLEVFGQRKLLKWSIPGLAHFFTFWAFVLLLTVYLEAYGALFVEGFAIPLIGHWAVLGFVQDFIAVMVLVSLGAFAWIRVKQAPERRARESRFYGSHTGPAWFILFMIFNVVWTLFFFRGVESAAGNLPYTSGAWVSIGVGKLFAGLSETTLFVLSSIGLILHIGVALAFLIIVLYSKHLHIFVAPVNVSAKRLPKALGPLQPMESNGKKIDFEDPGEDDVFGRGKIEDFTWKGMLDFATCTECGRCQSQCPAWNTGKPLSPKLVIMDLRDHLFAKAPYLIGGKDQPEEGGVEVTGNDHGHGVPESGFGRVTGSGEEQAARPLVGTLEAGGVIDPDVLWSCTSCGACVEQCPVDIEHVDHIVDMRRHQVMIESEFPTELGVLFRNLENKGNPWGQNNKDRMDWAKSLDFEVPVFDGELSPDTEYLFWVGCAGAFDDNAKKTVRATAELLHRAGVDYVVLGPEEGCTGDPARRSGNEFLFQMMAQQNVEMLNEVFGDREPSKRKIVTTCPHCMNTLGREYPQLDGHYEVVHHTQLLNKLVREKKLIPVAEPAGSNGSGPARDVTFHDPCYLGRHNEVYTPPRDLVAASGATLTEMPRHAERSMCCGAGGARMWMEEKIGKRVNLARTEEALATEAKQIATGCPFCRVMLTDGLTEKQNGGEGQDVEVLDVSQLLLASVKRGDRPADGSTNGSAPDTPAPDTPAPGSPEATPDEVPAPTPSTSTPATATTEQAEAEQAAAPDAEPTSGTTKTPEATETPETAEQPETETETGPDAHEESAPPATKTSAAETGADAAAETTTQPTPEPPADTGSEPDTGAGSTSDGEPATTESAATTESTATTESAATTESETAAQDGAAEAGGTTGGHNGQAPGHSDGQTAGSNGRSATPAAPKGSESAGTSGSAGADGSGTTARSDPAER